MKWWHPNFLQSEMETTSPLFLLFLFLLITFNFKISMLYAQEFWCVKILNVKNYSAFSKLHLAQNYILLSLVGVIQLFVFLNAVSDIGFNIRSHTLLSFGFISYIFYNLTFSLVSHFLKSTVTSKSYMR